MRPISCPVRSRRNLVPNLVPKMALLRPTQSNSKQLGTPETTQRNGYAGTSNPRVAGSNPAGGVQPPSAISPATPLGLRPEVRIPARGVQPPSGGSQARVARTWGTRCDRACDAACHPRLGDVRALPRCGSCPRRKDRPAECCANAPQPPGDRRAGEEPDHRRPHAGAEDRARLSHRSSSQRPS